MKNLKNIFSLLLTTALFTFLMTSCGSSHHAGCPGKDRPSFRGYGMTAPKMHNFEVLPSEKTNELYTCDSKIVDMSM
ncbi:MAG: hypothetical protein MK207_00890 [Saprospiraceae bacterium]|nr:hypothetical protein [Saprospiraceae bacterium]